MKIIVVILILGMLLGGCAVPTFETLDDVLVNPDPAVPAVVLLELPEDAAVPVMEGETGKLYFCDGYEILVETFSSGNLSSTLRTLTGFSQEEINPIKTTRCGVACYEGAWSAAGEAGDQVGRVLVLDDGDYHYCITILSAAENGAESMAAWQEILDSVALAEG